MLFVMFSFIPDQSREVEELKDRFMPCASISDTFRLVPSETKVMMTDVFRHRNNPTAICGTCRIGKIVAQNSDLLFSTDDWVEIYRTTDEWESNLIQTMLCNKQIRCLHLPGKQIDVGFPVFVVLDAPTNFVVSGFFIFHKKKV